MGRYSTGHLLQDTPVLSQPANAACERLRGTRLPKSQNVEANTFRGSVSEPAEGRWGRNTKAQVKLFPPTSKETFFLLLLKSMKPYLSTLALKLEILPVSCSLSSSKLVKFQPINKTTPKRSYRASTVRLYVPRVIFSQSFKGYNLNSGSDANDHLTKAAAAQLFSSKKKNCLFAFLAPFSIISHQYWLGL